MMTREIKRRGSVIYIKEPRVITEIKPKLKIFEKELEDIEKRGERFIHKEERKKKGILPKIIRLEEKIEKKFGEGEKEFSESFKIMRMRQTQKGVEDFLKNVKNLNYQQLMNRLKQLNEEYEYVKSREAKIKRKKTTWDEKILAEFEGAKPMDKDELKAFENAHFAMKKALLENIVKKERGIKRLGKII